MRFDKEGDVYVVRIKTVNGTYRKMGEIVRVPDGWAYQPTGKQPGPAYPTADQCKCSLTGF